jgi:hypothetical protein
METTLAEQNPVIIRTYKGSQGGAQASYQADAARMAAEGYFPTSQNWTPGEYGCGSFLVALLLCFILIGFIIFVYMLIVKPDGTLTVTYELRAISESSAEDLSIEDATPAAPRRPCPYCAELILPAARVCRFCSRELPPQWGDTPAGTL